MIRFLSIMIFLLVTTVASAHETPTNESETVTPDIG
jgi:hypothetical protein